ncbi:prepilin peptidase [Lacticaseibacillus kribbianus]|uniref:prepilin peptidase n=1 Tax=Lacticaseibacillus kribbianus TaxID=2926292 RepID=UPI001CD20EAF|nr:prepilin peptidase [Lacticaseibacillus kribbianus]
MTPTTAWILLGLAAFGVSDWRRRSVPAWPFDLWLVGLWVLAALTGRPPCWRLGAAWLAGLAALALATRGLGSADVLAIAAIAALHPPEWGLWWVLLACTATGLHHRLAHPATLPLLSWLGVSFAILLALHLLLL